MRKKTDVSRLRDRRHDRDETERDDEEPHRVDLDACERAARRREQPVPLGDDSDQQQAGDQRERRPDLPGGAS